MTCSFTSCNFAPKKAKPLSAEAAVAATDLEGWQRSRAALEQRLGLAPDMADSVLSDAFGWGSQVYWRQQKVQQPPSEEQVRQVLDFLGGLGIAEAELPKMVQAFPQVLGCEVSLLQGNVDTLQKRWFLRGRGLVSMLERKPQVLGTAVDCEGSCMAECNRCWARF
ncbi:hypothetical protein N2152v2_009627 [Parachlorella kessleri]